MYVNGNGLLYMDTSKPPLYSHDKFMPNSCSFEQVEYGVKIYIIFAYCKNDTTSLYSLPIAV